MNYIYSFKPKKLSLINESKVKKLKKDLKIKTKLKTKKYKNINKIVSFLNIDILFIIM